MRTTKDMKDDSNRLWALSKDSMSRWRGKQIPVGVFKMGGHGGCGHDGGWVIFDF